MGNEPVKLAEEHHGAELTRTGIEAMLGSLPFANVVTDILRITHPSKADQAQAYWRESVTENTNANSAKLEELSHYLRIAVNGWVTLEKHKNAKEADGLKFLPTGMISILEEMKVQGTTPQLQSRLAAELDGTEEEVADVIEGLDVAWSALRSIPGNSVFAQKIRDVLDGPVGKLLLRQNLSHLANSASPPEQNIPLVQKTLEDIGDFNDLVISLGDEAKKRLE